MIYHTGNWAGYSWNASSVTATFRTPTLRALTASERANKTGLAVWAGLTNISTVVQTGIYDHVDPVTHKVGWYGLYDFYPYPSVSFGGPIAQGDTIRASVVRHGIKYTITLTDVGHWTISVTKAFGHVNNTAVAAAENYSYSGILASPGTFAPVNMQTSGVPRDKWITSWATASISSKHSITIRPA